MLIKSILTVKKGQIIFGCEAKLFDMRKSNVYCENYKRILL